MSPCADILRQLATEMNSTLGSRQGSKHHKPDLSKDIQVLIKSMRDHRVYEILPGRTIEDENAEVPNIVAQGLLQLHGPLREFNAAFLRSQERRRMVPLVGKGAWRPPMGASGLTYARDVTEMMPKLPEANVHVAEGRNGITAPTEAEEALAALRVDEEDKDGEDKDDEDNEDDEDEDEDEDEDDAMWEACGGFDTLPLSLDNEDDFDIDDF